MKSAAEATGAPLQQLGQGLNTLQGFAPGVGASAVSGAGRSALAQGEYFQHDLETTGRFLASNPALAPLTSDYAQRGSELTRQQFQGIADLALSEGDMGAFNTAQMQADRSSRNSDPQYQLLARNVAKDQGWANQFNHFATGVLSHFGIHMEDEDPITQGQNALQARAKSLDSQTGADGDQYTREFLGINKARQSLVDSGLDLRIAETGFSTAQTGGASAASLRGRLPGISSALDQAFAADQSLIDTNSGLMNKLDSNDPNFAALRSAYATDINRARADQVSLPAQRMQYAKTVLGAGLEEDSAGFGLTLAGDQGALARGLYSGQSYSDLAGDESRLLGDERSRAGQVRQSAQNPLLSPADRSRMLTEATGLETQAAGQQNQFLYSAIGQGLNESEIGIQQAGLQQSRAALFGTPGEEFKAAQESVRALTAEFERLASALKEPGLTRDQRDSLTSRNLLVEGQIDRTGYTSLMHRDTEVSGMFADVLSRDETGLARRLGVSGNAAVTDGLLTDSRQYLSSLEQGQKDARGSAENSPTIRRSPAHGSIMQSCSMQAIPITRPASLPGR